MFSHSLSQQRVLCIKGEVRRGLTSDGGRKYEKGVFSFASRVYLYERALFPYQATARHQRWRGGDLEDRCGASDTPKRQQACGITTWGDASTLRGNARGCWYQIWARKHCRRFTHMTQQVSTHRLLSDEPPHGLRRECDDEAA